MSTNDVTNGKEKPGVIIDKIVDLDKEIDRLEIKLKPLKKKRDELEANLLVALRKAELGGGRGTRGMGYITKREFIQIENGSKFKKWILKTGALDIFQKRLSIKAYKEYVEQGMIPPGLKVNESYGVTVRKL